VIAINVIRYVNDVIVREEDLKKYVIDNDLIYKTIFLVNQRISTKENGNIK